MLCEAIDHVILAVDSVDAAAVPFERLGMHVTPASASHGLGARKRIVGAGGPDNFFFVELLEPRAGSAPPLAPGSLFAIALRVSDLEALLANLASQGVKVTPQEVFDAAGAKVADLALLLDHPLACVPFVFVQYAETATQRYAALERDGGLQHKFDLKRLDHLAALPADLEASTRFWSDVLGVPQFGEVVSPVTVVRQFKIGDAIIELLGPATPDSPTRNRPPGVSSMTAFEVPDLDAAVAQARQAGFSVSDPAKGTLPGTRVARIPAEEFGGLGIQLLEYV